MCISTQSLDILQVQRRVLTRFAEGEMKLVLNEFIAERQRAVDEDEEPSEAAAG